MKRALAVLTLIGLLAATTVVWATTVVKLDFDQLVAASDVIIVGHIATVKAFEQNGRVFTRVEVRVDETLKGAVAGKLEIVHIGGRTDDLVTRVHGMPSFEVGEHALLFLEQPRSVKHFVVTGLAQGKIALEKSNEGVKLVPGTEPLHTVPLKMPTGDLRPAGDGGELRLGTPPKIETLDDARRRIRALLLTPATSNE